MNPSQFRLHATPCWRRLQLLALSLGCVACEVEWGGGRLALEDPSPPEPEPVVEGEAPPPPLPEAPLLYVVRLRPDGRALAAPTARITADSAGAVGLAALDLPSPIDDEYRQRFAATFFTAGRELALIAGGKRIGSLVLDEPAGAPPGCLAAAAAQAFLPPGAYVPAIGFGVPLNLAPAAVGRASVRDPTNRMVTFGPVLAEQLLRASGEQRPFLAQRMALEAVAGEDTVAVMAATYLINDSLAIVPPLRDAASLFFLARHEPTRGFVPVWREVRTYRTAEEKEAFAFFDWLELQGVRFDFVRRFDASSERLAASRAPEDWRDRLTLAQRELEWAESSACPVLTLVE